MRNANSEKCRGQRGMSIAEALVAVLVFSVVFLAALALYQAANKAYIATDAATIQQQNVRFALDRVVDTLRNAGASYNITGDTSIPDEQIEGMWETAIFLRADLDNSRETALEDATKQPVVTIGNDEIIGYVLRKAGGDTANPVSITIKIDDTVTGGRDGEIDGTTITGETEKTIKVAAKTLSEMTATPPPYQLARVYFDDTGAVKYEVIADNIFRMSFKYYDSSGTEVVPGTIGGDDGTGNASRATRATVRSIDVNLIGMADRADFGYTDPKTYTPADTVATNRRKFSLSERVAGWNLGLIGKKHNKQPEIVIAEPISVTVCAGHAQHFYVDWPESVTGGIADYKLKVYSAATASSPEVDVVIPVNLQTFWLYQQPTTEIRPFQFSIAAFSGDYESDYNEYVELSAVNDVSGTPAGGSIPSKPSNTITAAASGTGVSMKLTWPEVTTNTAPLAKDTLCQTAGSGAGNSAPVAPWTTAMPDLGSYQVYRVLKTGSVDGSSPMTRVDNHTVGTITNTTPTSAEFEDKTAAPCSEYFYRLKAVDLDGQASDESDAMTAAVKIDLADGSITPAMVQNVVGTTAAPGANYEVTVSWDPVSTTGQTPALPGTVEHYRIKRFQKVGTGAYGSTPDLTSDVYGVTTFADNTGPKSVSSETAHYKYQVEAVYDCTTERVSVISSSAHFTECTPGQATITTPVADTIVFDNTASPGGFTPVVTTSGTPWATALNTAVNLVIYAPDGTSVYNQSISGSPTSNTYTFPAFNYYGLGMPDGLYTMKLTGTSDGCPINEQTRLFELEVPPCQPPGITITAPTASQVITRSGVSTTLTPALSLAVPGAGSWTEARIEILTSGNVTKHVETKTGTSLATAPTDLTFTTVDLSNVTTWPDGNYILKASGIVNGCPATEVQQSFSIITPTCGLERDSASFDGSGGNFAEQYKFKIKNTCSTSKTITHLQIAWTVCTTNGTETPTDGTPAGCVAKAASAPLDNKYAKTIKYGTSTYANPADTTAAAGNGVTIDITDLSVSGSSTSTNFITYEFSDNMTATATSSGVTATFTSILATLSDGTTDELIP